MRNISVTELSSGAYIIQVYDKERSLTSKFIKKD
ncbi:T9SS type A sorting domain-containing protein [Flavobacterium sp.]